MDLIRIGFMVSLWLWPKIYIRLGCSVSTLDTPQFSRSQPSLTVEELVEQRVGTLTAKMKAKYEAQEKNLEEIMTRYEAYFSSHYPLFYKPPRDPPTSTSTSTSTFELVIDLYIYLQLIFTFYKFCNSISLIFIAIFNFFTLYKIYFSI